MTKERAASDGSDSKRQSALDVVKPEGWEPPQITGVLAVAGWPKPLERKASYNESGYGCWLFSCPVCHMQWTRETRTDDTGAPVEICPFCKEVEVKAGL